MCVIIDREPGVVIPAAMIERACDINKHGYGIAFADRGRIELLYSTKANDPDEVLKKLTELRGHRVFLHLRHATVGEEFSPKNQHPFVSLSSGRKNKPIVVMMHNGTLWAYSPPANDKEVSDTFIFNERLVKPLFERARRAVGERNLLTDKFINWLLNKEIGSTSKVVFLDAFGKALHINKDGGKVYEGWWASNDYSFNDNHSRSSAKTYYNVGEAWRGGQSSHYGTEYDYTKGDSLSDLPWMQAGQDKTSYEMSDWEKELDAQSADKHLTGTNIVPFVAPSTIPSETRKKYELQKLSKLVTTADNTNIKDSVYMNKPNDKTPVIRPETVKRDPFIVQAGLKSLDQVGSLAEADLMEGCANWPQASAALIVDLLKERVEYKMKAAKLAADIELKERRLTVQADLIIELRKEYKEVTGADYAG